MSAIQYQLLYDADCPLCVWYTGYFKKHGYLQPGEVVPMQEANLQEMPCLHRQKMTNEIPLVDIAQQSVRYGTDAIIAIIGKKHPKLAKIASWRVFQPFIKTLYSFISFNRKVITGTLPSCSYMTCAPAFHLPNRMALIVFIHLLISVLLLPEFLTAIAIPFNLQAGWWMLSLSAVLGIAFFLTKRTQQFWMEILGQLTMWLLFVSLGGWLLGTVQQWFHISWITAVIGTFYFLKVLWPQSKQRWLYLKLQYRLYTIIPSMQH